MLQIVLFILKIIGMILLVVLGLVLGLLILILAAPVCYRVCGSWKEKKQVSVRVSWLYHIVGVMIDSDGQAPEIKIRIFGKILGQKKEKKKKPEPKKKDDELVFESSSANELKEAFEEPELEVKEEKVFEEKPKKAEEKASKEKSKKAEEKVSEEKSVKAEEEPVWESEESTEEESFEPIVLTEEEVKALEEQSRETQKMDLPVSKGQEKEKAKSHPKKKMASKAPQDTAEEEKKPSPALEMAKTGWEFIQNPNVKKLLKKLWKSICRILRHILPRKLNVKAHLGFEDPALNGKSAEAAAFLYAFYPKQFELVSDFEEEIIEVEGDIKGWLVPGYLLLAVIGMGLRVVLSRECRMLYKNIKTKR